MTGGTVPGGDERLPGYDVVAQSHRWDAVTTGVVLRRLGPPPKLRFFTVDEEAIARPLLDRLLAQDGEPRIPVFAMIDSRLAENETDGWRYDDMPEDVDAWRQSLHLLDEEAVAKKGKQFCDLSITAQREVLNAVRTADHLGPLPAGRVWSLWMRYACAAFYSHPWAWNEIGFGGPAYPRGYANLGLDAREHWEVREVDARDPVPWAERVEAARRRHETNADRR